MISLLYYIKKNLKIVIKKKLNVFQRLAKIPIYFSCFHAQGGHLESTPKKSDNLESGLITLFKISQVTNDGDISLLICQ